jgi:hypothetical protein
VDGLGCLNLHCGCLNTQGSVVLANNTHHNKLRRRLDSVWLEEHGLRLVLGDGRKRFHWRTAVVSRLQFPP